MKILITSDSTCALSREEAKKIGLPILPLNVIVDGTEYHDGIDIDPDKLCKMMRNGSIIKTSTPTPYEIEEFFDRYLTDDVDHIIHFTISSKLSSMFDLFTNICKQKYGERVTIIDAYSVCYYMLTHVLTAKMMAEQGKSVEEIVSCMKNRIGTGSVSFIPETLTYLKNGGRISPAQCFFGNMLGLKPVINFEDGGLVKDSTTRNMKKTLSEVIDKFAKENLDPEVWELCVVVFDADEKLVEFVKGKIEEKMPNFTYHVTPLSINVCAHTGPGTIGIGTTRKVGK